MTATAKNNKDMQQRSTSTIGIGLFYFSMFIFVVALIQSIPGFINANATTWSDAVPLLLFALSSTVPILVGFFIGLFATKRQPSSEKKYNGMLLAMTSYWLSVIVSSFFVFTSLNSSPAGYAVTMSVPLLISTVVTLIIGAAYAKQEHQPALFSFTAFRIVGACIVAALFVLAGVSIAFGSWFGADIVSSIIALFLPVVMVCFLVIFGAWLIGEENGSGLERAIKSLVGLSILLIVTALLARLLQFNPALASYGVVVGIVAWIVYVYYLRKYPSSCV